jgi:hypothetical protein
MVTSKRYGTWAILLAAALVAATTNARAQTTVYTSAASFDAVTTGLTGVFFTAPSSTTFTDYATGLGGGYTDSATGTNFNFPTVPAADGDINVTGKDYYAPGDPFPEDFITAAVNTAEFPTADEVITLPKSVTAFGMDISNFGDLSTIYTLSNGDIVTNNAPPAFGNVAFFGITDSTPFSTVTISGVNTLILDVSYGSLVPLPSSLKSGLALLGLVAAFSFSRKRRRLA